MPHLFSFVNHESDDALQEMEHDLPQKHPRRRPSLLKNIGSLLRRHHHEPELETQCLHTAPPEASQLQDYFPIRRHSLTDKTASRKAIPSLPRPQTFHRQESERREKLLEVENSPTERRALSADQRRGLSSNGLRRPRSPRPGNVPFASAPQVGHTAQHTNVNGTETPSDNAGVQKQHRLVPVDLPPLHIPEHIDDGPEIDAEDDDIQLDHTSIQEEYDQRWILNLSMHFRDKSNREKFFVTYAEPGSQWRRLTVSLDYRNAPEGSLEADLSTLHYQRDKSFRIYEAIRESLPDIQYYPTVTNLKLETTPEDGQLHVHVREDANEIIQYPPVSSFDHVLVDRYTESEIEFISHLSGFVYKVKANGVEVIKKEIPGPDTVDEFLYEVNALESLLGCSSVVQLKGLVTDDDCTIVKGLLITYASQGALVDMLYDHHGKLPWHRREKWAKQIVSGLSEIHEAGFVQGDFTLSNIVIDGDDNAQIIDINRRGCPVGWEPPELGRLIDSGQRIGMCIGVKTDLYQLGMVLWALAMENDEPEREPSLLPVSKSIPSYFRRIIETCLSEQPQGRAAAKKLLRSFPPSAGNAPSVSKAPSTGRPSVEFTTHVNDSLENSTSTHRSAREYIDPDLAVTIDEVRRPRDSITNPAATSDFTSGQVTYLDAVDSNPASTTYRFDSSGSWVVGHRRHRGRSPVSSRHRRRSSPYGRTTSSRTSLSSQSPASARPRGASCDSVDDRINESNTFPPPITNDDLKTSTAKVIPESPQVEHEPQPVPTALHKRLVVLQHQNSGSETSTTMQHLIHTDSGFDEPQLYEDHETEAQTTPKNQPTDKHPYEPSTAAECVTVGETKSNNDDDHHEHLPQ